MKMGIKEFRELSSRMPLGDEVVIVTHHGKRVGRYIPDVLRKPAADNDMKACVAERQASAKPWLRKHRIGVNCCVI